MSWWQRLRAGHNNIIIQAQNYYAGNDGKSADDLVSYSQVEEISKAVFERELEMYTSTAKATLAHRVTEFSANYFNRQTEIAPDGINSLREPFMQKALRTAEIEFGATGNADTGESLADLLVQISQKSPGSMHSVLLSDALTVVPKLNSSHTSALTLSLIFKLTIMNSLTTLQAFYQFLVENIVPLADNLPTDSIPYRHLVFTQTAWLQPFPEKLKTVLRNNYGGHFSDGFEKTEIPEELAIFYGTLIIDHERRPGVVRFKAVTVAQLDAHISSNPLLLPHAEWIRNKFESSKMDEDAIMEQITNEVPGMNKIVKAFEDTDLDALTLTSVGIVIAHANWQAMNTGVQIPLETYIPDS